MDFHFDCIFHSVKDMETAIQFYRDVLGFKLVSRDEVARFDMDGVLFELVPAGGTPPRAPGNARLCLQVENVEAALRELKAKGVRTGSPVRKRNGVLGSFEDPEGNEICVWEYAEQER